MLHNSSNTNDYASGQRNLVPETSVIMKKPSPESCSRKADIKTGGDVAHPRPGHRRSILSPTAAPFFPRRGLAAGDISGSHAVLSGPDRDCPPLGPLAGARITPSGHLVPVGQSFTSMAAPKHARSLSTTAELPNAPPPRPVLVVPRAQRHVRFAPRTSLGEPINEGGSSASFRKRLLWQQSMTGGFNSGAQFGQLPPALSPLQVHPYQLRQFGRPHPHQFYQIPMNPRTPPPSSYYAPPQIFPRFHAGLQLWSSANPVSDIRTFSQGQPYYPNFSHAQVLTPEYRPVFAPSWPTGTSSVSQDPRFSNFWRGINPSNEYRFAPQNQPAWGPHGPPSSYSKPPYSSFDK